MGNKFFRHKFNAKPTTINDIRFASKLEAAYYVDLLERVKPDYSGDKPRVIFFLMQTPFHLAGGVKYVIDFQEFHEDGTVHFIDVKGRPTPMYKLKKKLVESQYPIKIEEVK